MKSQILFENLEESGSNSQKSSTDSSTPDHQLEQNAELSLPVKEDLASIGKKEAESNRTVKHLWAIADSVQDAIVSADSSGHIIFWNEGARKHFGYQEHEVLGKSLSMLMPERYHRAHREGMRRYLETGETHVIGRSA